MIDGAIARKTGAVSEFGARLDTVADFVFMAVCAIRILPLIHIPVWLWIWVVVIAMIKIFDIVFVFICKKQLISIHSVLNKTTGFSLFLLPLSLSIIEAIYSVATICVLATIAVMQEVYFVAKGRAVI